MEDELKTFLQGCGFGQQEVIIANFERKFLWFFSYSSYSSDFPKGECITMDLMSELKEEDLAALIPLRGDQLRLRKSLRQIIKKPKKNVVAAPRELYMRDAVSFYNIQIRVISILKTLK